MALFKKLLHLLSESEAENEYSYLNDWEHNLGFDAYGNPIYKENSTL